MIAIPIAAALLVAQAPPADRVYSIQTGNDLLAICGTRDGDALCLAWVTGLVHGIEAQQQLTSGQRIICRPEATGAPDLRNIIAAFLQERPDLWEVHAGGVAFTALARAFPCPNSD